MKISTQLRLSAGSLAVGFALASAPAFAQSDGDDSPVDISSDTTLNDVPNEVIVVTGSRIARPEFDSVSPTFVVGEELLEDRQFNNVADALNEVPFFGVPGQSRTGTIGNADVGQNFVNFFGLGSQRTLTVVNGRRFVAANAPTVFNNANPGLQVDLNVIPSSMVERIETVTIRGAPIYGSDAISGTVNVILKDDFEGLEIGGTYGISDRSDAEDYRVNAIVGGSFGDGRGHATIGIEYQEVNGLRENQRRSFLGVDNSFQPNPANTGSSDGIPDRVLIENARVSFATFDGIPALFFGNPFFGVPITDAGGGILQFGPNGDLIPFDSGTRFGAVFADGGDGVPISDINTLSSGVRRTIVAANADYEITDNIRAFAEFNFANTQGQDLGSQAVWNTDFFSDDGGAIQFNVTNPFLTPQASGAIQATCDANGLTDPADCNFLMARYGRTLTEGENRTSQNLYRIVVGLDGEFQLGDRDFNWELAYNYGRTENNSNVLGVNSRRFSNALNAVALTQAQIDDGTLIPFGSINVVRGGQVMEVFRADLLPGDIACQASITPPTPAGTDVSIPEQASQSDAQLCVPLNYFGEQNTTSEARSYVQQFFGSDTVIDQKVFTASVGGELFDTWAGGVSVVIGYEHRDEAAQFIPDSGVATGLQQGTIPITPTAGGFKTDEFFAETLIPLWDGEGVFSSAIAEAAFRYVDNSRSGTGETWTAGGQLGFFDDQFVIRGNFTRAIRSPALVELFLPQSATNSRGNDPCDPTNIGGGSFAANRTANCQAEAAAQGTDLNNVDADGDGMADDGPFQSVIINGTRQGFVAGNTNLTNEVSDSYTIGALLQPDFVPGLTIAADYVNIKIDNAIANLNLSSVFQACYDDDPANFPNQFCARFSRAAAGDPNGEFQVVNGFQTGFENAGFRNFQGVTAQVSYVTDVADLFGGEKDLGRLSMNGQLFHLIQDEFSVTGFDLQVTEGEVGRSKWRGQMNLNWDFDSFGFLWQTRYVGKAVVDNDDSPEARDFLGVGDYWTFNAGIRAQVNDRIELRLNVDNVFDNDPPFASGATANQIFAYDILGRYYRVGAKLTF